MLAKMEAKESEAGAMLLQMMLAMYCGWRRGWWLRLISLWLQLHRAKLVEDMADISGNCNTFLRRALG